MLRENEEARLLDENAAREHYDQMLQNDKDILNVRVALLELQL